MTDTIKVADDIYMVPWSEGNGQIRREVWVDRLGKATRYLLAYINRDILASDDGRVLGYQLDEGSLKVHRMGTVTPLLLSTLEEAEERFALEWDLLSKQNEPLVNPSGMGAETATVGDSDGYSETKGMHLTITKGTSADFFRRGRELACKLDRSQQIEPEKVVIFGDRHDLCYSQMPKR
jgi:hypothetical protein